MRPLGRMLLSVKSDKWRFSHVPRKGVSRRIRRVLSCTQAIGQLSMIGVLFVRRVRFLIGLISRRFKTLDTHSIPEHSFEAPTMSPESIHACLVTWGVGSVCCDEWIS